MGNDEIVAWKRGRVNRVQVSAGVGCLFEKKADELSEEIVKGGNEEADDEGGNDDDKGHFDSMLFGGPGDLFKFLSDTFKVRFDVHGNII